MSRRRILSVLCQQRAADLGSGSTAMRNMMQKSALVLAMLAVGAVSALAAGSEDEFKAAYAAAETANKEAAKPRNQWPTTAATLAAAKKSADAGEFDKATASAKEAEALAKASIFQATSEKTRWRDMEIR